MWRKHLSLFTAAITQHLQFRTELVVWLITTTIPYLVLLYLWQSFLPVGATLKGFSLSAIIWYYLAVLVINIITQTQFESWRSEQIRDGKIDLFLTRPLPYVFEVLWQDLGANFLYSISTLVLTGLGIWVAAGWWQLPVPLISGWQWLVFGTLLIGAYCLNFLMAFVIVILSFWFEGSEGLQHFKWLTLSIFSGSMIPVTFMPAGLQHLVGWLPFKYMYAYPIEVLLNQRQLQWFDWLYFLTCIVTLAAFTKWLWHQGQYRYASGGG